MKIAIKILQSLLAVLLCCALLLNLWMLVQQLVLKREAPEVFGYSQYIVTSGSMEPVFSAGDMILVRNEKSYELGDIVTFHDPAGQTVTHKIVGSVEGQFITQGVANNTEDDDLLPPERIIGKLQVVVPGAGWVMNFLRTPLGILILVAAAILLIGLPWWLGKPETKPRGKHAQ